MCGIAGIYKVDKSKVSSRMLESMTDIIEHRGPDGFGYWFNNEESIAFGHRRLSIIDLTDAGKQPMQYMGLTITYNGEIYNYIELKNELQKKGYNFFTQSDTEVLLALYHCKGKKCLEDLDGMFSFAIWDENKQELFCARDRFGEKPFYYYHDASQFIFGSEIKQIFTAGIKKELNKKTLYDYCLSDRLNTSDLNETFFKNIYQLPHSHYLLIQPNKSLHIQKYWDISYQKQSTSVNISKVTEQFNDLLFQSVRRRLRSDVPIGTSLSGGLDSTTIAAFICRQDKSVNLNSFTASFLGFEKDETKFIKIFKTKYSNLNDHYVSPTSDELVNDIDKLFFHQDEPIGSTSIYAQYRVMQLAKQNNVTVLLDGQGADEYLGGYNQFWPVRLREMYGKNDRNYLKEKQNVKDLLGFEQNINFNLGLMIKQPALHKTISKAKNSLIKKEKTKTHSPFNSNFFAADNKQTKEAEINMSDLNSVLYNSIFHEGLQNLLRFADRNSMAHSREVRLPFLDHKIIEFVFSLPSDLKMIDGWSKFILRKAQNDFLPKEICWRKEKVGYATPQAEWLKNKRIEEMINDKRHNLQHLNMFDATFINGVDSWKILNLSYLIS